MSDRAARVLLPAHAMTANFPIGRERARITIVHELVCARCGHGESLHASDRSAGTACLACQETLSAGLPSRHCGAFAAERLAPIPAPH